MTKERSRFILIFLLVGVLSGAVLGAFSYLVAPLPVSGTIFSALNFGVWAALSDMLRRRLRRSGAGRLNFGGFGVLGVALVTGSALLGTRSLARINPEVYLSTAILVLTAGYVGFVSGVLSSPHSQKSTGEGE